MSRNSVLLLALVALVYACVQPPEIIVEAAAATEPEAPVVPPVVEPEPEPVPMPAPGHIWILDASDALLYDCEAGDWAGAYDQLVRAARLTVESHNGDFPADPWHYVEGGPA
ncbi:MAG TPA: hypothetical protein VFH17_08530 [Coriobacteriia bacterium]|nr:hypothetical protein [Coriobacteriia bacterium]